MSTCADLRYSRETVADGLEASCLAMISATLGFAVVDASSRQTAGVGGRASLDQLKKGSWVAFTLGVAAFVLQTAIGRFGIAIPGLQAVLSTVRNFLVVGACGLVLHRFQTGGARVALIAAAGFALATPAVLLVTTAILSDSIELAIVILAFYLSLQKPRSSPFARNLLIFSATVSFALIFAIFYLQMRGELRSIVWGGGSVQSAIETTTKSITIFEIESVGGFDTLTQIDARLNQNIFIGLAIARLRLLPDTYEEGATIAQAGLGWIPRFLWPEKPERGGAAFISKHTGVEFSGTTTFGAGPIFELFVNFGYPAVLIGFVLMGALVRVLDVAAFRAVRNGDLPGFAKYHLAGMAIMPALADLFFIVASLGSALLIGWGARVAWSRWMR